MGCALNGECVLSSSETEASGEVTVKSTARGDIAALPSASTGLSLHKLNDRCAES